MAEELWTLDDLAAYLNMKRQAIYDYRYKEKIAQEVFIRVGRNIRVLPDKARELTLKGELILD